MVWLLWLIDVSLVVNQTFDYKVVTVIYCYLRSFFIIEVSWVTFHYSPFFDTKISLSFHFCKSLMFLFFPMVVTEPIKMYY